MSFLLNPYLFNYVPPVIYPEDSSFVHIETATLTSSANSIDFTSIPSTYRQLQLRTMLRSSRTPSIDDYVGVRFNGSSTTYPRQMIVSRTHTANASVLYDTNTFGYMNGFASATGASAEIYGVGVVDIPDYRSTTVRKSFSGIGGSELGSTGGAVSVTTAHWPVASAITSISLICNAQFVSGSTVSLYGIVGT